VLEVESALLRPKVVPLGFIEGAGENEGFVLVELLEFVDSLRKTMNIKLK
jgi:hypothetical protein